MAPNPFCWIFLLPLHFCFFFYIKVMFKSKAEICSAFKHCLWDSPRRIQTKWIFLASISFNSSYSLFPFPRFLSLFVILFPPPPKVTAPPFQFCTFSYPKLVRSFFSFFFLFLRGSRTSIDYFISVFISPLILCIHLCANRTVEPKSKLN